MRLLILALFSLLALPAQALEYDLAPRQIAPDTWLLEGSTGNFDQSNGGNIVNTVFIVTSAGVVVVDTGPSRLYGEAMRKAIARITDKPVVRVLLTHHHPDHVLGTQAFSEAPVAALPAATKLLKEEGNAMAENMYRLVGDWMRGTEVVLPSQALEPGVLEIGGHRLQVLALHGHTNADLALFDQTTGVMLASDILFFNRALTTPHSPGLDVWLADLDTLQALPWKLIVPGHGPVSTDAAPFEQMRDYLTWLDTLLRDSAAQGLGMNEVMNTPIPERFAGISQTRYELIRTVNHLYPRYEAGRFRRLNEAGGI